MVKSINRRRFLGGLAAATAGVGAGVMLPASRAHGAEQQAPALYRVPRITRRTDTSRVAVIKGDDRKQNLLESLDLIKDDIKAGIGDKQVIIKVNFTSSLPDAGTHVDMVRAICETITPFYKNKIIVTEGQGMDNPLETDWMNFGYYALEDEFNVELRDEWDEPFSPLTIVGSKWQTVPVNVCETWRDPDTYMISAAVLKRHRWAVVTMSLKNVLMASIWNHDGINHRHLMRVLDQDRNSPLLAQQFAMNQFLIGQHTAPDLAVIDGFAGMEEQELTGPLVDHRVAIAGADFLAADAVGAMLMEVDLEHVGTLMHCANAGMGNYDPAHIEVLGHSIAECKKPYAEIEWSELMRTKWRL